tara:strand:+ start:567 stop:827 length:261 start_codon:yes stop_codon:yes gene_type:complete
MNKQEFTRALKRATLAESKLHLACSDMAIFFQPYFKCEISVLYQESDGFVILYNTDTNDNQSYLNDPVEMALKNIQEDEGHYLPTI